jgi:hypothetical protein
MALRGENRLLHHAGCLHVLNIPYFTLVSDKICIVFVWWLSRFIGRGGFLSRGLASKKGLQQFPIVLVSLLKIRWLLTAGDWLNAHFVNFFIKKKSQFILSSTEAFNTPWGSWCSSSGDCRCHWKGGTNSCMRMFSLDKASKVTTVLHIYMVILANGFYIEVGPKCHCPYDCSSVW